MNLGKISAKTSVGCELRWWALNFGVGQFDVDMIAGTSAKAIRRS